MPLLNDTNCVMKWRGNRFEYGIGLALQPSGKVLAQIITKTEWRGRVPGAAHVLAEKLNRESDTITWEVHHFRNGTANIIGWVYLPHAEAIDSDVFGRITGEMIRDVERADILLIENGYA